jgi:hypothetical protein
MARHFHLGATGSRRSAAALTLVVLLSVACAADPAPPAPVASDALPGQAGDLVELDPRRLSTDAVDAQALVTLLESAGFVGGTQRAFSQSDGPRAQRSLVRVLGFADVDGARTYLAWLRDHIDEVIGKAELVEPPGLPAEGLLAVATSACCPKATDVHLAAWLRGSTVVTLEVGGEGIDLGIVQDLAATLDEEVTA